MQLAQLTMRSWKPILAAILLLIGGMSVASKTAQAAILTDSATLPTQALYSGALTNFGTTNFGPASISATLNKFDSSYGTLTGVVFSYNYNISTTIGFIGFGLASETTSGSLFINAANVGSASGTASGSVPFVAVFNTPISNGSFTPVLPLSTFIGTGTYTFSFTPSSSISFGGLGFLPSSNTSLTSGSVSVEYTFDPPIVVSPVPEPASFAALMAPLAFVMWRRRKAQA